MTLAERPHPDWSVERVTAARLTRNVDPADAAVMAAMPELAQGWRTAFEGMGATRTGESSA